MAGAVLSLEQQDDVWAQWRSGQSVRSIARDIGAEPQRLRRYLAATGGVRIRPADRSPKQLSLRALQDLIERRGAAAQGAPSDLSV